MHCLEENKKKLIDQSKDGIQLIKDGTGKYISYHDNDTLQVVGEYLNSLQTGLWTWHYDNGALQYIEHFSQGKQDGEYIFYYRNGQIRNTTASRVS